VGYNAKVIRGQTTKADLTLRLPVIGKVSTHRISINTKMRDHIHRNICAEAILKALGVYIQMYRGRHCDIRTLVAGVPLPSHCDH
jgi:hypothetical protein